jgi:hypothetical protein
MTLRTEVVSVRVPEDVWDVLDQMEAEGLCLDKNGEFVKTWALIELIRRGMPFYKRESGIVDEIASGVKELIRLHKRDHPSSSGSSPVKNASHSACTSAKI